MDTKRQKLALSIVGLAQGAITVGTENADPLIRGHLHTMVEHGHILTEQKDEIISAWEVLREDIDYPKPRGVTEVSLKNLISRLQSLHAA